jgi:uncharacterized protein YpmB
VRRLRIRTKFIVSAVFGTALILTLIIFFYNTLQASTWSEQTQAVQIAYEKTILAKASKVETFAGEQPYDIIYGEDKLGQKLIVWVGPAGTHTEYEADGISRDEVNQKVLRNDPTVQIVRTMPGKLFDDYVWEVFYKKPEEGRERYYYDFYLFTDGSLLDTYQLSLQ